MEDFKSKEELMSFLSDISKRLVNVETATTKKEETTNDTGGKDETKNTDTTVTEETKTEKELDDIEKLLGI